MAMRWTRLFAPAVLAAAAALPAAAAEPDFAGHWEGAIELPGTELGIRVDLERGPDGWHGTIDIPMQGAAGLPLADVAVDGSSITFAIAGIPGAPTFRGTLGADGTVRGPFVQSGQELSFRMSRDGTAAGPARPQQPEPPFPYRSEDVTFASGDVTLAGTVTVPAGPGPFPGAVLLTGSGAQNRDEELFGHRPFAVIADHLSRHGVAVLRFDDRGVGGSTGSTRDSTTADFAADALAAVRTLAARPDVDAGRVGLIGHSEGGIVAPLAASRSDAVAFVVLLAGTGVPLDEVILEQTERISRIEAGMSEADAAAQRQLQGELLRAIEDGAPADRVQDAMRALVRFQVARLPEAQRPEPDALDATVASQVAAMTSPWARYALTLDPRAALRTVTVPALVLNGSRDLQVSPAQNVPEIVGALLDAGNPDVTARVLPGLNHLFQPSATGAVSEYAAIETTVAPEVLEMLSGWIGARFGAGAGDAAAAR